MSVVGIVVLSVIGGLFLAILVGLASALIYLFFRARAVLTGFQTALRTDLNVIHTKLESQQQQIVSAIGKLNGDQLAQAAVSILQAAQQNTAAAKRIELAALAIGELIIPATLKQETSLAPEEYAEAEAGERFVSQNPTAVLDSQAMREE